MSTNNKETSAPTGKTKKFLFDGNDFDKKLHPNQIPAYSEEQLLLAKNQAYAQGHSEGLKVAVQSQEQQVANILSHLTNILDSMVANEEKRDLQSMANATNLAMRVTKKILPHLAERFSVDEIESVILQSLETRKDEPRVAITLANQHLENIKGRINSLAAQKGFSGKIIILGDENMNASDCRVEWADGGAERLYDRLFNQIEEEFTKALQGMTAESNTAIEK